MQALSGEKTNWGLHMEQDAQRGAARNEGHRVQRSGLRQPQRQAAQRLDELAALVAGHDHGVEPVFDRDGDVLVLGQLGDRAVQLDELGPGLVAARIPLVGTVRAVQHDRLSLVQAF